jgi:hypothetical protein
VSSLIRLNTRPDQRTLRQFGIVALVVFGALAALAWAQRAVFGLDLGTAYDPTLVLLSSLAGFSLLCSLLYPTGNRGLFVALQVVGYPIGVVVSYLILGLLFFGAFGLTAVVLRLIRRTPIPLICDSKQASYWIARQSTKSRDSYFRQY